ncbi:protein SPT2 homolog isoform X2 [Fagus crenata]
MGIHSTAVLYEGTKSSKDELEYLELRRRLKEGIREDMKKEMGSALGYTQQKEKLPHDNFGFFFGPSQPAISQRVIEESKKSPKFQQLASRVTTLPNVCMGISLLCVEKNPLISTVSRTKSDLIGLALKAERQALKAKKLKYYQDFSSFFSDDEELTSLPTKEPQLRKVSVSNLEAQSAQLLSKSKQTRNMPSKKASDNIIEKKQASVVRQLKAGAHPNKVYPALKLSSLKQQAPEGHNASLLKSQSITRQKLEEGNKFCQLKKAKVLRDKLHSSLPHQTPHRCTASTEKFQSFQKEKEFCERTKAKVMPKKPKSSLENQIKHPMQDHSDDDSVDISSMCRRLFRRNPRKQMWNDDDDDGDMVSSFDDIQKEDRRSAKIGREEDRRESLLINEEKMQKRKAKKQKLR